MPGDPNKLSQFWQELKRRKVVRVITVYAAATFAIIDLLSNIDEPLGLPEWTLPFAIVFLSIGFIISVIISWIYDIHPEGGIVKTEPTTEVSAEPAPSSSKGWKIASYISFVVIVGLIVLNVMPRTKRVIEKEILEKSIAVLPFINDSEDIGNEHIINGIMEEILINLQSIKELRVPGRTSIEQYRNNPKPIPEIASELNVAYILEGSGQRYGNKIRLRVQLVEGATDRHLWADSYDEVINGPEDIFRIQSQIAESIAAELEAIITPEEKQLIEKIPTTSIIAHEFYSKGRDKHNQYWLDNDNRTALERAEELYHDALDYDSTFALAYTGLAYVYWDKHYWETYFSESFLDSVFILTDIALSYDDQLAEAYTIRGDYYRNKGLIEKALEEYDKALKINPNDWMAFYGKGKLYAFSDYVKCLNNLQKAASLNRSSELPGLYREIAELFNVAGFSVKGSLYSQEALNLDGDSVAYLKCLSVGEWVRGNFAKSIEYLQKSYAIDSSNIFIINTLGFDYMFVGQFEESLKYYKKYIEKLNALGNLKINEMHRIGYSYWKNGYKEEAEYYINQQLDYCIKAIELGRQYSQNYYSYYDLATIYAFRGEKEKAYQNLRIFTQKKIIPLWAVNMIKKDYFFNSIRDEPEFQQIVRDLEAKYQAEHERVRQWLEENDRCNTSNQTLALVSN